LGNGALWGLGIGAGLAAALLFTAGDNGDADSARGLAIVGIYGGAGAGIGVGIDAVVRNTYVILERPVATPSGWALAPSLSSRGQGVRLTFRF
jgi:hypothetical protein